MSIDLASLNSTQLQAVEWQDGPLLVLAGPGSGKTRVLTFRIARLIEQSQGERFRILGITFTNKAAAEMRNRIDGLVTEGRDRALLTTFHSFSAEILRQHGSHIGLKPDFTILSEPADRQAILGQSIKAVIRNDSDFRPTPEQLLPALDRLLADSVSPAMAKKHLGKQPYADEIADVYVDYRRRLVEANQMDFGSLLAAAVELLEQKPAIAKQIRRTYRYVCVDEFQDTNAAQYRLLASIVLETTPNLFVVADDDQIIYQWTGASPQRMEDLRSRFAMRVIQLPENYRCPPEVIDLANNLIRHNEHRSHDKKDLSAHKAVKSKGSVTVKKFEDFEQEAEWIAERMGHMPVSARTHCVVLARTKKLLEKVVDALNAKSISAYIAIRKNEFQSPPLRWLHSMLRLANSRQDREQLRRVCAAYYSLEGLNFRIDDVIARAAVENGDFLRSWIAIASEQRAVEPYTKKMLRQTASTLLDHLDHWAFINSAFEWLEQAEANIGIAPEGTFDEFKEESQIWRALEDEITKGIQRSEMPLHNFLQELDLRSKERPVPPNAVRCFTIHASKGMEFKHVFLIGLVEDQLPSWAAVKKGSNSQEMNEERRNCFVAITRSEETLTLTYAATYFGYSKQPSRFLAEMGV